MTDIQVRDLASAAGLAAVANELFDTLIPFGSGRPLAEWVNPHRRHLPSLAAVVRVSAYGLLSRGSLKHRAPMGEVLAPLVREERAPAEVVGAASLLLFGATLVALGGW